MFSELERLSNFFLSVLDSSRGEEYKKAVFELERAAYLIAHAGTHVEVGMLVFWPYVISDVIMADIYALDPHALVLISYFCVLFGKIEGRFWFLQGWTDRLFSTAASLLAGHAELLELIEWPRKQVYGA